MLCGANSPTQTRPDWRPDGAASFAGPFAELFDGVRDDAHFSEDARVQDAGSVSIPGYNLHFLNIPKSFSAV
jgi:hypothetical protein